MKVGPIHIPKAIVLIVLIQAFAGFAGSLIGPIEVRLIETLTQNSVIIGSVFGVGSVFFAVLSVMLGRLSDRYGRKRLILLGLGLGILYPILYATAANAYAYAGFRFFWAASAVTTGPVLFAYLQDMLEDHANKGQILGYVMSLGAIVGSAGSLTGGLLSDLYGLRAPYYAATLIFFLGLMVAFKKLQPEGERLVDHAELEQRHPLHALQYIFKRPILIFYFIFNTSYSLNWGIRGMLWPFIIFGLSGSDTVTGSVYATMGMTAFLVLMVSGKIADKHHPIRAMFLSFAFLILGGYIVSFTSSLTLLWIAAAIIAVGEAIQGPAQGVLLTDYVDKNSRGEILGADAVFDNVLAALSPVFAGFLLLSLTPQHVLGIYVTLQLFSVLLGYLLFSKKLRGHLTPLT